MFNNLILCQDYKKKMLGMHHTFKKRDVLPSNSGSVCWIEAAGGPHSSWGAVPVPLFETFVFPQAHLETTLETKSTAGVTKTILTSLEFTATFGAWYRIFFLDATLFSNQLWPDLFKAPPIHFPCNLGGVFRVQRNQSDEIIGWKPNVKPRFSPAVGPGWS